MSCEDNLVNLYRMNRKNGRLQEDLKIQEMVPIGKSELAHMKILKQQKIQKMLEEISEITIEFPEDTICLKYSEHQQKADFFESGIELIIFMTYYIFRCPNR